MRKLKIYTVIGLMSGTSMDGLDCSLIETDGQKYTRVIKEKMYKYSNFYKKNLKKLIFNLPEGEKNQIKYTKENEIFITKNIVRITKKFIKFIKYDPNKINLIGLSGQTIIHNPEKKYSIQLCSGKELNAQFKIPVISNFRQKDLRFGGQGAPIGSFYHKNILDKINKKAAIINLGGVANITFSNKKKLISYDMGPSNALIDDLCYLFYKKKFDKDGILAKKGKPILHLIDLFKKDKFFRKKYPKSLDREYFSSFYKELKNSNHRDAIRTASMMTIFGVLKSLTQIKDKIELIIFTGGGRKNKFIISELKKKLMVKKIETKDIDILGLNGDMIESQMFGYLAVRSVKKLPLSLPSTTGVSKPMSGGILHNKFT